LEPLFLNIGVNNPDFSNLAVPIFDPDFNCKSSDINDYEIDIITELTTQEDIPEPTVTCNLEPLFLNIGVNNPVFSRSGICPSLVIATMILCIIYKSSSPPYSIIHIGRSQTRSSRYRKTFDYNSIGCQVSF
jgi:hypothetical protein